MTDDVVKHRGIAYAEHLSCLSPEERWRINERARKQGEEEHKAFHEKFQAGQCWVCGESLTSFDPAKPCPHWLLKPNEFGKEHFELITQKYSLNKLEHYLRWVANEEAFAKNINDLADEGSGKLVELTIKYKNLLWSFSCSASDLSGHDGGGEHSKRPHWHFQMYVDDKPFIRYNDFHAALSDEDVALFEHIRKNPGKVRRRFAGGTGMGDVLNESTLEQVVAMGRSVVTDEEANAAPIDLSTIVIAEPGKTISGEDIYNLIQAAKAENVTITSKLRGLKGANVRTMVSAGPGVVPQAVRSGGRKRKRGNRPLIQEDREWRERLKRESDPAD
ncbi:hypothetical protein ACQR1W_01930 [Bradyrhizobium sp. HKCCYLS1011]|uniref:hypothetical protein n=1 Tax=Bradyrhizobium sp. HKCCYLS1011 TaxID=3420733 RepID=UPI003EBCF324